MKLLIVKLLLVCLCSNLSFADEETVVENLTSYEGQNLQSYADIQNTRHTDALLQSAEAEYEGLKVKYGPFSARNTWFNEGQNRNTGALSAASDLEWILRVRALQQRLQYNTSGESIGGSLSAYSLGADLDSDGTMEYYNVNSIAEHQALNERIQARTLEYQYRSVCQACGLPDNCCGTAGVNGNGNGCSGNDGGLRNSQGQNLAERIAATRADKCTIHCPDEDFNNCGEGERNKRVDCSSGRTYIRCMQKEGERERESYERDKLQPLRDLRRQFNELKANEGASRNFMEDVISRYVDGNDVQTQYCIDQAAGNIADYNELEKRNEELERIKGSIQQ